MKMIEKIEDIMLAPCAYINYVYYNGGGRYPWRITTELGDTVNIAFFSDNYLSADEGYCLMYFSAPQKYSNIKLYLDNTELDLSPYRLTSENGSHSSIYEPSGELS